MYETGIFAEAFMRKVNIVNGFQHIIGLLRFYVFTCVTPTNMLAFFHHKVIVRLALSFISP